MEQIIWKTSWFAIVSHALYVHRDVKMRKCSFCDWNIINCTQSIDVRTNSMDLFWNCGYCLELLFYYSCIKKQFAFYFTFFSFDFAKSIYGHSLLFVIWVLLLFVFWGWRGGVVRVGRWSLLGYCGEDDEKFLVVSFSNFSFLICLLCQSWIHGCLAYIYC